MKCSSNLFDDSICSLQSPPKALGHLWQEQIAHLNNAPARKTFVEWVGFGKKFARLAAGGTIYLLVILAGLELRWEVAKASHDVAFRLGEMLRKPKLEKKSEYFCFSLMCSVEMRLSNSLSAIDYWCCDTNHCSDARRTSVENCDRQWGGIRLHRYKGV